MHENAQTLSEKLIAIFPATTYGYSMEKIACLDDAFSAIFEQQASPVEGRSLQIRKDEKGNAQKI